MMPELYLADALGRDGQAAVPRAHRRLGRRVHRASSPRSSCRPGSTSGCSRSPSRSSRESEAMWALSLPIPFHAAAARRRRRLLRPAHPVVHGPVEGARPHRDPRGAQGPAERAQEPVRPPPRARHHLRLHQGLDDAVGPDPLRRDVPVSSDGACAMVLASEAVADRAERPVAWVQGHGDALRADDVGRPRHRAPARRRRVRRRRLQAGRHHRPAQARSTASRCTCRSRGSSRCGSRTSASRRAGRGLEDGRGRRHAARRRPAR